MEYYYTNQICEDISDRFKQFKTDVAERVAMAKKIAEKYKLAFITLQAKYFTNEHQFPIPPHPFPTIPSATSSF